MKQLESLPQVGIVRADQCQYGAEAQRGPQKGQPVKKPTGFISNSCELLKALSRRCAGQGNRCSRPGGGGHATCSGNVCKDAAIYLRELCRAVLRGFSAQLKADGRIIEGCYGIQLPDEDSNAGKSKYGPDQGYS